MDTDASQAGITALKQGGNAIDAGVATASALGVTIPFVELIGGFLVLVGLFTTAGLSGLGAVLCVVTFGHLLHEPLYALHEHVIPRLALTVLVLALPRAWDRFSVDAWRQRGSGGLH